MAKKTVVIDLPTKKTRYEFFFNTKKKTLTFVAAGPTKDCYLAEMSRQEAIGILAANMDEPIYCQLAMDSENNVAIIANAMDIGSLPNTDNFATNLYNYYVSLQETETESHLVRVREVLINHWSDSLSVVEIEVDFKAPLRDSARPIEMMIAGDDTIEETVEPEPDEHVPETIGDIPQKFEVLNFDVEVRDLADLDYLCHAAVGSHFIMEKLTDIL
jgi:hypothetical protein